MQGRLNTNRIKEINQPDADRDANNNCRSDAIERYNDAHFEDIGTHFGHNGLPVGDNGEDFRHNDAPVGYKGHALYIQRARRCV